MNFCLSWTLKVYCVVLNQLNPIFTLTLSFLTVYHNVVFITCRSSRWSFPFLSSNVFTHFSSLPLMLCRSRWPRGLRRRFAATHQLGLWVRIPPGAWTFVVSVVCCQVEVSATS